jgi:hypothetical protein
MGRVKDYYWDIITSPDWLERQTLSPQDISDCCEAEERIPYHELEAATMPRTESYMSRHRPICAVLEEIRTIANEQQDNYLVQLADEAISYAKRMDAKLVEIRNQESEAR